MIIAICVYIYIYTYTNLFQWDCEAISLYLWWYISFLCVSSCVFCYKTQVSFHGLHGISWKELWRRQFCILPWKITYLLKINGWKNGIFFWKGTFLRGHVNLTFCGCIFFSKINHSIIAGYELEDLNGNFTLPELFCRALCSSRMDCAAFEVGAFGWGGWSLQILQWQEPKHEVIWKKSTENSHFWTLEMEVDGFGRGFSQPVGCVFSFFRLSFGHPSVVSLGKPVRFVCVLR